MSFNNNTTITTKDVKRSTIDTINTLPLLGTRKCVFTKNDSTLIQNSFIPSALSSNISSEPDESTDIHPAKTTPTTSASFVTETLSRESTTKNCQSIIRKSPPLNQLKTSIAYDANSPKIQLSQENELAAFIGSKSSSDLSPDCLTNSKLPIVQKSQRNELTTTTTATPMSSILPQSLTQTLTTNTVASLGKHSLSTGLILQARQSIQTPSLATTVVDSFGNGNIFSSLASLYPALQPSLLQTPSSLTTIAVTKGNSSEDVNNSNSISHHNHPYTSSTPFPSSVTLNSTLSLSLMNSFPLTFHHLTVNHRQQQHYHQQKPQPSQSDQTQLQLSKTEEQNGEPSYRNNNTTASPRQLNGKVFII